MDRGILSARATPAQLAAVDARSVRARAADRAVATPRRLRCGRAGCRCRGGRRPRWRGLHGPRRHGARDDDGAEVAGADAVDGALPYDGRRLRRRTSRAPGAAVAGWTARGGGGGGGFDARGAGAAGWPRAGRGRCRRSCADDRCGVLAADARRARLPRRARRTRGRRGARPVAAALRGGLAGRAVGAARWWRARGAVPKTPIDGTPSEPPTDSVCERPIRPSAAAQPPTASVVAALAPKSCVRALRATRRCRRSARTRTSSGSHSGGGWYSGSGSALGSGSREPLVERRVLGRDLGGRRDAARARQAAAVARASRRATARAPAAAPVPPGPSSARAARGALRSTSPTLTGAAPPSASSSSLLALHAQDDPARRPDSGPPGFLVQFSDVHDRPPCPFARGAVVITRIPRSGIAGSIEQRSASGHRVAATAAEGAPARCRPDGAAGARALVLRSIVESPGWSTSLRASCSRSTYPASPTASSSR